MNREDHRLYHSHTKKEYWENLAPEEAERVKNKIRKSLEENRSTYTEEDWQKLYDTFSKAQQDRWDATDKESPEFQEIRKNISIARQAYLDRTPGSREKLVANFAEGQKAPWTNTRFIWTQGMLQRVVEVVKTQKPKKDELLGILTNDNDFVNRMKTANPPTTFGINHIDTDKFTYSKLHTMYKTFGYSGWKDFTKKTAQYNHRIVKLEYLTETMDVGTLTIDGKEIYHNHHTFATESGIFVKNSMIEDLFFAQTSDGRGSKVDTLPGGECLSLDTEIKLLDGRDVKLSQLIVEFQQGKQNWVYSCNPETGEIVPGPITWAGVTRKDANGTLDGLLKA